MSEYTTDLQPDVILIGAGIMSATLGIMLKELDPTLTIAVFEGLDSIAAESSDAWNNAGTGHAALCELNYTPQLPDGSVEISKAVKINESFEISQQLWAYLVSQGRLQSPKSFINRIPHLSFVRGKEDVTYLRKRFEALQKSPLFEGMEYSEDPKKLTEWMPLMMDGRDPQEPVAANRMAIGTDVNFGALTRALLGYLKTQPGVSIHLKHEVRTLHRSDDGFWNVVVKDNAIGEKRTVSSKFVFLGAGGGALPLLQKSGIAEGKGFGGFPVSGQWLRCDNAALIKRHDAKVYGKASIGSPPMSVPHLDTRMIDGEKGLLFGPFAGFSTQFLKKGSFLDLPLSIKPDNLIPMVAAGLQNIPLTKYLIGQVLQSPEDRMNVLREFVPGAKIEDWKLVIAGQRVQVIKKDPKHYGILQFGTEMICSADGSIAALLGASPGASTAVPIMIDLIQHCFKDRMASDTWRGKLKEMIPSQGESLANNRDLLQRVRTNSHAALELNQ